MDKSNKQKKDGFDKWLDKHVVVMGMGRGNANKKAHKIIRTKVKEKLIKQVKEGK